MGYIDKSDNREKGGLKFMSIDKWLRTNVSIPLWLTYKGINYFPMLSFIKSFHKKSIDEIREYQFNRLKMVIENAYVNVPFYHDQWKKIGLEPSDIKSFEDFTKIPILTKNTIRNNTEQMFSRKSTKNQLIKSGTGGTTDSPIIIYYNRYRAKIKEAEMHYFREWFNWYIGNKIAYLWGAPQDIPDISHAKYRFINRVTFNKLYLFSSLMNKSTMKQFINKINQFKPDILQGYSNPVYILADFILKNHVKIHFPKSIVLTAEPCHPFQREIIEKAFGSEVFTFYGCREGGYVGCECHHHSGYHINCSSIYMEFITKKGQAKSGDLGDIVFTDLYNFDMPFIRYQIGDLGIPDENPCPCGSNLPLMKFFAGRETEVFITPDGSLVPGVSLCDRIIEDCEGVQQLQFIQEKIDELIVKIVKGPKYSDKDLNQLDNRLDNYFQGKLNIVKIFVDDIPKEKSGKTRFCISKVPKGI